jgi:hypothetical protein
MSLRINSIKSLLDSIDDQLEVLEKQTFDRFNNDSNSQRNYELNSNNSDNVRSRRTNNINRNSQVNENNYGNLFESMNTLINIDNDFININNDEMNFYNNINRNNFDTNYNTDSINYNTDSINYNTDSINYNTDSINYNGSNGSNGNDINLTQTINNSFLETEYNYQGVSLNSNDSSILNTKYNRIGTVGECHICCEDTKKICKCGVCNFQYCQDCLKRVITDFNKCSSCGNKIDITKLEKISLEDDEQDDNNQQNHLHSTNGQNNNQQNKNNRKCKDSKNDKNSNKTKFNKKNKINNTNNTIKQLINFLFYKEKNKTIKVIFNENQRINKSKYTFEIKINNKNNFSKNFINFDTKIFNTVDISYFYNIITKDLIPWDHFIKLYENNLHIISNNIKKKNEFMTHIESYMS